MKNIINSRYIVSRIVIKWNTLTRDVFFVDPYKTLHAYIFQNSKKKTIYGIRTRFLNIIYIIYVGQTGKLNIFHLLSQLLLFFTVITQYRVQSKCHLGSNRIVGTSYY